MRTGTNLAVISDIVSRWLVFLADGGGDYTARPGPIGRNSEAGFESMRLTCGVWDARRSIQDSFCKYKRNVSPLAINSFYLYRCHSVPVPSRSSTAQAAGSEKKGKDSKGDTSSCGHARTVFPGGRYITIQDFFRTGLPNLRCQFGRQLDLAKEVFHCCASSRVGNILA